MFSAKLCVFYLLVVMYRNSFKLHMNLTKLICTRG